MSKRYPIFRKHFHNSILILKISVFIFFIQGIALTQTLQWRELPGVPLTGRYDDLYFINANTGWVLGNGIIYKTTNSGYTWENFTFGHVSRSTGFFDSQNGIIGNLNHTTPIIKTTNGGVNWSPVSNLPVPIPEGICGISIVDTNTAYACGSYYQNGRVYKTTDKGSSWSVVFNDSSNARTLVDCYFWSSDSGLIAGGYNINSFNNGVAVVLLTTNGGNSWQQVYRSTRPGEWCWKISFNQSKSKSFGVISIERFSGLSYYLKTTNSGFSWTENPFMFYNQEGIGFLNETTGWIGGYGGYTISSTDSTTQTTDGGLTWKSVGWSRSLNRIRFINDTLAFACGSKVSKYSRDIVNIAPLAVEIPGSFMLYQNFPNPFNPLTVIKFDVASSENNINSNAGNNNLVKVSLIVYDQSGKTIRNLINENLSPGSYRANFDGGYFPSGIYYYKLVIGSGAARFSQTKKMVMIK